MKEELAALGANQISQHIQFVLNGYSRSNLMQMVLQKDKKPGWWPIDYTEIFNPIAKHTTVKFFLASAAFNGWFLAQLGVNKVVLNGDLVEDVYMELPQGFQLQEERVNKSGKS